MASYVQHQVMLLFERSNPVSVSSVWEEIKTSYQHCSTLDGPTCQDMFPRCLWDSDAGVCQENGTLAGSITEAFHRLGKSYSDFVIPVPFLEYVILDPVWRSYLKEVMGSADVITMEALHHIVAPLLTRVPFPEGGDSLLKTYVDNCVRNKTFHNGMHLIGFVQHPITIPLFLCLGLYFMVVHDDVSAGIRSSFRHIVFDRFVQDHVRKEDTQSAIGAYDAFDTIITVGMVTFGVVILVAVGLHLQRFLIHVHLDPVPLSEDWVKLGLTNSEEMSRALTARYAAFRSVFGNMSLLFADYRQLAFGTTEELTDEQKDRLFLAMVHAVVQLHPSTPRVLDADPFDAEAFVKGWGRSRAVGTHRVHLPDNDDVSPDVIIDRGLHINPYPIWSRFAACVERFMKWVDEPLRQGLRKERFVLGLIMRKCGLSAGPSGQLVILNANIPFCTSVTAMYHELMHVLHSPPQWWQTATSLCSLFNTHYRRVLENKEIMCSIFLDHNRSTTAETYPYCLTDAMEWSSEYFSAHVGMAEDRHAVMDRGYRVRYRCLFHPDVERICRHDYHAIFPNLPKVFDADEVETDVQSIYHGLLRTLWW